MTATGLGADAATAAGSPAAPAEGRRPWWVWTVPSVLLFALLCARNRFLFTAHLYEQGDAGANSILIEQARHFTLLVGNYSRERFHHPGPAYMYVQAFGEYLFRDALHVVPTAWNAHMLSVFALNAAFVAMAVAIVYGWTRSLRGAVACLAVFAAFAAAYPPILNSDWMPYMYVVPYMVFVLAAGSVAAGCARDAWIFAASGWLLIHGQACFLLFVPVMTVAVLAAVLWPRRRRLRASVGAFFRTQRGTWIPVAAISAAFLLPIVVNLVLHWPGDFGKYVSYGTSSRAGGHGLGRIIRYALWFWLPHRPAWQAGLAVMLAAGAAIAVSLGLAGGRLRRFALALLAVNGVSTLTFLLYAAVGIDDITDHYIGYFYWSAPLVTVLVIMLGLVGPAGARGTPREGRAAAPGARPLRGSPGRAGLLGGGAAALAAVAAFTALAVIPGTRTSTKDIDDSLPRVVATLAAQAHGRPIVLHIDPLTWVEATGFLVQAERTGVRACLDDSWFTFLVTRQFICTPAQAAGGRGYWFYAPGGLPRGTPALLRFSGITVARAPS
jgi:hypothetical protein